MVGHWLLGRALFWLATIISSLAWGAATPTLYRYERYKFGSAAKEIAEFKEQARQIGQAQARIKRKSGSANGARVLHRKAHGCLTGTLVLRANRDRRLRFGILADNGPQSYNTLAHFTNGFSFDKADLSPDVRGLAIKLFGAIDPQNPDLHTVDLLMTNSPRAFGKDLAEFVEFVNVSVDPGPVNLSAFAWKHPETTKLLASRTLRIVSSLAQEQYWAGHGYLMGPEHAVKLNLDWVKTQDSFEEVSDELRAAIERANDDLRGALGNFEKMVSHWIKRLLEDVESEIGKNYLRKDLVRRAKRGRIHFVLQAQLEKPPLIEPRNATDPIETETPLEDELVEWTEEVTPSLPVGDLYLDMQNFEDPVQEKVCEDLRFTPARHHTHNRPLGNMGRGRAYPYQESADLRGGVLVDPNEQTVFKLLRSRTLLEQPVIE